MCLRKTLQSLAHVNLKHCCWFVGHRLSVASNEISGQGLCDLADSLHKNFSVAQLFIWGNDLQESCCIVSLYPRSILLVILPAVWFVTRPTWGWENELEKSRMLRKPNSWHATSMRLSTEEDIDITSGSGTTVPDQGSGEILCSVRRYLKTTWCIIQAASMLSEKCINEGWGCESDTELLRLVLDYVCRYDVICEVGQPVFLTYILMSSIRKVGSMIQNWQIGVVWVIQGHLQFHCYSLLPHIRHY